MSAATHKVNHTRSNITWKLANMQKICVSNHVHRTYTKKLMWQVSDVLIEARSPIQAGGGLGHLF